MKYYLFLILPLVFACQHSKEAPQKVWLEQPVRLTDIQPVVNTYHMFDSTRTKVGFMSFGTFFENGKIVSRDTSSFDDGSVYEVASFVLDTSDFLLEKVDILMQINKTKLNVDVNAKGRQVNGLYRVTRDTIVNDYPVDSLYAYDIFRSELYMLMQAIDYTKTDTLNFKALVPTSMTVSDASIYWVGNEKVTVPAGDFDCTVVHLVTDGKMPENRIWITKDEPRKLVKFFVPGPDLTIELINSRV